jgi:hypothetical protein
MSVLRYECVCFIVRRAVGQPSMTHASIFAREMCE